MQNADTGQGGTFEFDKDTGERRQVQTPPKRHPDGDRARDEDGKPLDQPVKTEPALPAPGAAPWANPTADKTGV